MGTSRAADVFKTTVLLYTPDGKDMTSLVLNILVLLLQYGAVSNSAEAVRVLHTRLAFETRR
jgi:hypothetical protein